MDLCNFPPEGSQIVLEIIFELSAVRCLNSRPLPHSDGGDSRQADIWALNIGQTGCYQLSITLWEVEAVHLTSEDTALPFNLGMNEHFAWSCNILGVKARQELEWHLGGVLLRTPTAPQGWFSYWGHIQLCVFVGICTMTLKLRCFDSECWHKWHFITEKLLLHFRILKQ